MDLFYSENITNDSIVLNKIETNHCMNVLRYSLNDRIRVVDGKGNLYVCLISDIIKKQAHLEIKDSQVGFDSNKYYVHIVISPIKSHDRLEWFVEKAIEIGIDKISFISCDRTLRKNVRNNRISNVAITAMKQTLKARIPEINYNLSFSQFIKNYDNPNKFICYLGQNNKNLFEFKIDLVLKKEICILIGPEGDFADSEIKDALESGFRPLTLGSSRLRTETAGIVACHLANIVNRNL
ncbi:MAG: 16S rRNA (uracil(1498)-N(3))-methyltransferase [Candidatus Marinimicrobia bacterium]|mgnify:CR=1 FL=1|nr:16S rRNA (uracil(1498)-N(3))-methyltransferase [Candidatus Neomarinimicrobiota bacterium]|tara:strand:+ start:8754 stop:9467 length:714 start_codon:yes stop_codon:yes gene_type:complete